MRGVARTRETGVPYELELEVVSPDGAPRGWMLARGEAQRGPDGTVVALRGVAQDITARKQAELRLARTGRLYATLGECNAAIIHCRTEEELFARVCEVVVRFGGMALAWVGRTDPSTGAVHPQSMFGDGQEYLQDIRITVDGEDPHGRGPTGRAIRENRPVWFEDFMGDSRTLPWHARGASYGWRASAALPLCRKGTPIGALTFYSTERSPFDDEIRRLLAEMALQIGYALDKFDADEAAEATRATLVEAEQRFRSLVEQSIAGAFIHQDDRFAYVNPRLAQILGYESGEALQATPPTDTVSPQDRDSLMRVVTDLLEGRASQGSVSYSAMRRDGTTTEVGVNMSRATYQGRVAIIGLMQDISDRKVAEDQIRRYNERLLNTFMQTVALATTLSEMRDPYTAGHERRVADIAVAIGRELHLDASRLEGLRVAGNLHDVGKTALPSELLAKPGRLNTIEFELIKGHAAASYEILKAVDFPWPVAEAAYQHHERMDGSGYPRGLKGDQIMLEARILAVADVLESMSSHHPYRPALGLGKALEELERGRGSIYDADVVDALLRLVRDRGYVLPA